MYRVKCLRECIFKGNFLKASLITVAVLSVCHIVMITNDSKVFMQYKLSAIKTSKGRKDGVCAKNIHTLYPSLHPINRTCVEEVLSGYNIEKSMNYSFYKNITYADDISKWQYFIHKVGKYKVLLRSSVFADDRHFLRDTPCLRLLVMSTEKVPTRIWRNLEFYITTDTTYVVTSNIYVSERIGVAHKFDGLSFHHRIITIYGNVTSGKVTVFCNDTGVSVYQNELSILTPSSEDPVDFAVVTKPLFGQLSDQDVPYFIEWIEINRLFGIQEIHIYNSSLRLGDYARRVFKHYSVEGFLVVHQYHPPVKFELNTGQEFHACELLGRTALAEALATLHKRVQYVIIIDLDELIIPRIHASYQDMMKYIANVSDKNDIYPSYVLFPVYFFQDQPPDNAQPSVLKTLRYRQRSVSRVREVEISKSITQPGKCLLSDPHYCRRPTLTHFFVSARLALLHHYRSTAKYIKTKHLEPPIVTTDDIMLKFKTVLLQRMQAMFTRIGYTNYTWNK